MSDWDDTDVVVEGCPIDELCDAARELGAGDIEAARLIIERALEGSDAHRFSMAFEGGRALRQAATERSRS